jgi:hypothetical protein
MKVYSFRISHQLTIFLHITIHDSYKHLQLGRREKDCKLKTLVFV